MDGVWRTASLIRRYCFLLWTRGMMPISTLFTLWDYGMDCLLTSRFLILYLISTELLRGIPGLIYTLLSLIILLFVFVFFKLFYFHHPFAFGFPCHLSCQAFLRQPSQSALLMICPWFGFVDIEYWYKNDPYIIIYKISQ